jgi:hypothetical protein
MSKLLFAVLAISLLAACSLQPTATALPTDPQAGNPYAPQPGDGTGMQVGEAEIVSASVLAAESFPPQITLTLAYRLPTPCYQLRAVVHQPDSQLRILVDVYGVTPVGKACTLMALSTPLEASLGLGSFPAGHYTVWVNGVQVGEFDS